MRQFYFDFAATYGTCWLVLLAIAILTGSRVNAGEFGLYGFPVLGLLYAGCAAAWRGSHDSSGSLQIDVLRREIAHLRRRTEGRGKPSTEPTSGAGD
jgi:hypothetical protein